MNANQGYPLRQNNVSASYSRYVPSILFQRTWGGSNYDSADAVALDSLGDLYVAGMTNSFCCGAFLVKYNSTGSLLWQRVLLRNNSSPYYDSAFNGIAVDSSGNVDLVGYADSSSVMGTDVLLVKFDSNGNLLWQETWGGIGSDTGQSIVIDHAGGIYIAGTTSSFTVGTYQNVFVLKLRANGSLVWQETWADLGYSSASGIGVDSAGNLYVSGSETYALYSPKSAILLKLNSTGALLWQNRWEVLNQNSYYVTYIASAVAVDSAGSAYVTGASNYGIGSLYFPGIPIIKFNPEGTIAWQRLWVRSVNYCCQQSQKGNSIALDSAGNIHITGQAGYYPSETTPTGFLMLELSPNGGSEWQAVTGVNDRDVGRSLALDSAGNAFAVGDIYEIPPPSLLSENFPVLSGNFTLSVISGQLTSTNATVSPLNVILSTPLGLQTYTGYGDAYLLKLQPPTPSPPSPPLALVAQAGQNNITVSWAPPQYTGGQPITGYKIYRGINSGAETFLANTTTTHVYVDDSVKSGVTYYYFAKAVNTLGESDSSNEYYATVGAPSGPTLQINPSIYGGAAILVIALVALVVYQRRKRTLHFG